VKTVPMVTVVIPAYNQVRFLGETIKSVLGQTAGDFELIVVNDGSTDGTRELLDAYRASRIQVLHQENRGLSAARNAGLEAGHGRYVAFLDADALWLPNMLATTVAVLEQDPEVDMVAGGWDEIDEAGDEVDRETGIPRWTDLSGRQTQVDHDFPGVILRGNMFPVHVVVLRRSCLECCGRFDTKLQAVEDWDLWIRLAIHGHRIHLLSTPVARYRKRAGSMSRTLSLMEEAIVRMIATRLDDPRLAARKSELLPSVWRSAWVRLAEHAMEIDERETALRYCRQASRYSETEENRYLSSRLKKILASVERCREEGR